MKNIINFINEHPLVTMFIGIEIFILVIQLKILSMIGVM